MKHKTIPLEPTKDMVIAGGASLFERGLFPLPDDVVECCKAMLAAAPEVDQEPVDIEFPLFHCHGMGCGLEDKNITDRYEAMRYGWDNALDRFAEILDSTGSLYTAPQPVEQRSAPDVAKLVEALERLVLAAQCRDNSTGDQIRLIETRAELSAAAKNAEEALALYRKQGGDL